MAMGDKEFQSRAIQILHNMALERVGFWRRLIGRWHISHEPLRNDAANLLRESNISLRCPYSTDYVGWETKEPKT